VRSVPRSLCLALIGFMTVQARAADEAPSLAPGVAFPPVSVTTNKDGVPVHHFSLTPVVTNVVATSNDIARLTARLAEIDAEFKQVSTNAVPLKTVMRENFSVMAGIVTNYVPLDDEGKQIKARVVVLEAELKELRQKLEKRMMEDPAYQKVKENLDAGRTQIKELEQRREALRSERSATASKIWQLQTLTERAEKEAAEKAAQDAKAKPEGATKSTP